MRPARFLAFTLIEMLVTIGVVGLLAALLLPAIQSARELARRIQCGSNLKQIGLAAVNYVQGHGSFPYAGGLNSAGQHLSLLPFLEQETLFNAWNFGRFGDGMDRRNNTIQQVAIAAFLCPSDQSSASEINRLSYPANQHYDYRGKKSIGLFGTDVTVKPAMISDGLSSTTMFGEFLTGVFPDRKTSGSSSNSVDLRRFTFWISFAPGERQDMSAAINRCGVAGLSGFPDSNYIKGRYYWMDSLRPRSGFDHHTAPNSPTCLFDPNHLIDERIVPTSSMHPGGVQILFADGHVRFIKNTIDSSLWRSLGTRAGGEAIQYDDF